MGLLVWRLEKIAHDLNRGNALKSYWRLGITFKFIIVCDHLAMVYVKLIPWGHGSR